MGEKTFSPPRMLMPSPAEHPLGPHFEIGWRLVRRAWGHGYATEAADAALKDVFDRAGLVEVLAYTSPDNLRSQAVMARLRLRRDPARDFTADYNGFRAWRGLVWVAAAVRNWETIFHGADERSACHGDRSARLHRVDRWL
jgi:RimJ/RimL family protein N-acetyltransferase